MKSSASAGATPDFCASSPTLTCTSRSGQRALPLRRLGDRVGQARTVERLDHVGHPHRVARLVGLQAADQVQPQRRMAGPQAGKLGRRLLHAVFAELHLAGRQGRPHRRRRDGSWKPRPGSPPPGRGRPPRAAAAIRARTWPPGCRRRGHRLRCRRTRRNSWMQGLSPGPDRSRRRNARTPGKPQPPLWLFTDRARLPDPARRRRRPAARTLRRRAAP